MGYVMVPVPEEHVEETMQMILRITSRARLEPWDEVSTSGLFREVDEPTRSVLSTVGRSGRANGVVSDVEVADAIEMTQREVLGIVREANERAQSLGRLPLVVVQQDVEVLPNGRTRERRVLSMDGELAVHVQAAERSELESSPHPLMSDNR